MKTGIYAWLITAMLILPVLSNAQYVVRKSSNALNTTSDGFFYSLPKTVFKVHVTYETVKKIRGPLADYTEEYLGTLNYITQNGEFVRVIDASLEPVTLADPNETYWVQFTSMEKSKEVIKEAFTLSPIGTLLAFDDVNNNPKKNFRMEKEIHAGRPGDVTLFPKDAGYNRKEVVDTIVRKIVIDTVTINRFLFKSSWVDRTEEEKADDAARQIAKIREARYNLMTGFQEVNYGESIKYMDSRLQQMERQYLDLFLGKETRYIQTKTIVFEPEKNRLKKTVLEFSDTGGGYQKLQVVVTPQPLPEGVKESMPQKIGNLFYRIPVSAKVEISDNGKSYFTEFFPLPQLGGIGTVPMEKNKLQFDFVTGTLTKIKREITY